jgi:hypothetical protein
MTASERKAHGHPTMGATPTDQRSATNLLLAIVLIWFRIFCRQYHLERGCMHSIFVFAFLCFSTKVNHPRRDI